MLFRPLASLAVASTLLTGAMGQINLDLGNLLGLDLDIGLLQNGALVNINAFAKILSPTSCPSATVGLTVNLLGLVKVCSCVNALNLVTNIFQAQTVCPACPTGASPICGGPGTCACACNADYFATAGGVCIPRNTCEAPNVITPVNGGVTSTCTCAAGYISNGAGGCVLASSARARMSRKQKKAVVPKHPHAARAVAAHQEVFRPLAGAAVATPKTSERIKNSCPTGETACALPSGGFECLDVTSSLMSCGGCVGEGQRGVNCLAIPGALNVECHNSECQIASCFKGWRFVGGKCA